MGKVESELGPSERVLRTGYRDRPDAAATSVYLAHTFMARNKTLWRTQTKIGRPSRLERREWGGGELEKELKRGGGGRGEQKAGDKTMTTANKIGTSVYRSSYFAVPIICVSAHWQLHCVYITAPLSRIFGQGGAEIYPPSGLTFLAKFCRN